MPAKETIRLYLVVALALVALVVAYFQFFSKKEDPAPQVAVLQEQPQGQPKEQQKAAAPATARSKSYKVGMVTQRPAVRTEPTRQKSPRPILTDIRDIFEPPSIPPEAIQAAVTAGRAQRAPKEPEPDDIPLVLKGTLIGGKAPMAIINEKFIRLGEKIDIFRVVRIEANRVVLKAGKHMRVLTVLKPDELLNQ